MPFRTPVVLRTELSPEEVVCKLQELTRSRHGFTAFHLYDREIEGRVWADQFWVERHTRRLLIKIISEGTGSKLAGHFFVTIDTFAVMAAWVLAVLWIFFRKKNADRLGVEFLVPCGFLFLPMVIVLFQLWRSSRVEPVLIKFVEETLHASVIESDR